MKWPNTEHNLLKGQQLVIASMWKAVQVNQRSRNCRIKRRQMEVDDALPGPISWRRSLGRPMATMRSPPPLAFQLLWTTRIGTRQRRALIGQSHKLPAFPWIDFSWGNGKRFFFFLESESWMRGKLWKFASAPFYWQPTLVRIDRWRTFLALEIGETSASDSVGRKKRVRGRKAEAATHVNDIFLPEPMNEIGIRNRSISALRLSRTDQQV